MTELSIVLASPFDRESVVAELWLEDVQFAEVSEAGGAITVEIYPRPAGEPWDLPFDDLMAALNRAHRRLIEGRSPNPNAS